MQFLVTSDPGPVPPPPEMGAALMGALLEWAKGNLASGKFKQAWGFAGIPGGGAIVEVDSVDELDEIMSAFPMAPFSNVQVRAILDIEKAIANGMAAQEAMMKKLGGG